MGPAVFVEEYVHALRASLLHCRRKVAGLFVVDPHIETDLLAPLQLVAVSGNGDRMTSSQLGDLADELSHGA